jgi:putative peptidoglycan lipid II flippase
VHLAEILAWAMVAGSAVQFLVQVPPVLRAAPGIRLSLDTTSRHVRTVARSFLPVLVARGVVQISAYIDSAIASLVGVGAVSIFAYAQAIYLIPGRIFGTAISAAELPAMASLDHADPALHEQLCRRLSAGLGRIAYFIIPSVAAFLTLGDVIASAVFRYGRFSHADALWVWGTLAGSTVGLLASTMGRLYASAFYALKDTRTPLRFALIRVTLTLVLGYVFARHVPRLLGIDPHWGTAGLTASAGIAGWLEFMLLRHALNSKIGPTGISASRLARLWAAAIVAAAVGWGVKMLLLGAPNLLLGIATCGAFGVVYLLVTTMLGEGEGRRIMSRVTRRVASRGR